MHALRRPKVLVVDDNEQNRLLAEETLRSEEYEVALATTGEEALAKFGEVRPDLVLLDVRMPGLDGFTICTRLRAMPGGAATAVVFLTALRDVETYDRALRSGADDFLTKPIRPAELLVRVQTLLRIRRLSAELNDHFGLLRRQRDDLVRLQLQREQLMAFVVHDLKNPVSSIDLHASLLTRDRSLSGDARESATWILHESRNLMRLILNLLDISKAEDGALTPKRAPVDLGALVATLAEGAVVRAEARRQRVEIAVPTEPPVVHADVDLLRRVLENLLDDALRHAPEASRVALEVAPPREDGVHLRVSDWGPGIPEALRERIFEKYVPYAPPARRGLSRATTSIWVEAHMKSLNGEAMGSAPGGEAYPSRQSALVCLPP